MQVVDSLGVLVAHVAMMPWWVMLGEVVGQVELAWGPDEIELALVDLVLHPLVAHVERFGKFLSHFGGEDAQASFATDMAKDFHSFVKDRVVNSSDWALRLVGQFFLQMFDYLLMCQSKRLGDSILVEHCYARFLPVFSYTGKRNYFELCCSQMEWHYLASANVFHQV